MNLTKTQNILFKLGKSKEGSLFPLLLFEKLKAGDHNSIYQESYGINVVQYISKGKVK